MLPIGDVDPQLSTLDWCGRCEWVYCIFITSVTLELSGVWVTPRKILDIVTQRHSVTLPGA